MDLGVFWLARRYPRSVSKLGVTLMIWKEGWSGVACGGGWNRYALEFNELYKSLVQRQALLRNKRFRSC